MLRHLTDTQIVELTTVGEIIINRFRLTPRTVLGMAQGEQRLYVPFLSGGLDFWIYSAYKDLIWDTLPSATREWLTLDRDSINTTCYFILDNQSTLNCEQLDEIQAADYKIRNQALYNGISKDLGALVETFLRMVAQAVRTNSLPERIAQIN